VSHPASEPDKLADRRAAEWRLRVKGWSIREIARHFGLGAMTVHDDLEVMRKEIADETKEAALKFREIELARLDEWIRAGNEQLESLGEIRTIKEADKEEQARVRVDTIAPLLNSLRGLSERRAKLLGLDGPVEFKGSVDGELSPEAIRLAIAAEFSSRAVPSETDSNSGAETQTAEPASATGTSGD
jgi:transposase